MKSPFRRILLIVLDGVGTGAAPDARQFGDEDSHTLLHIHKQVGLTLPHMAALGLCHLIPLSQPSTQGAWGKMQEKSSGKDTTTGHWELAGVILPKPFPTYANGFPAEIIDAFCSKIDRQILANRPASGTQIIEELGDEHVATGKPIVYTSADSVFQIAAHEQIIPLDDLYRMCKIAREILHGDHAVGRVIARPFIGSSGNYQRTKSRRDFSLPPVAPTVLDHLSQAGLDAVGVGKISDVFAHRGLTDSYPEKGNPACFQKILDLLEKQQHGLIFVNLVDFDSLYGHRNNPQGFADALEWFDQRVPDLYSRMDERDLLIITADHGNDPTTPSTDHSREYVPLLVYHHRLEKVVPLGIRESFTDVAKTILENFSLADKLPHGTSFLSQLI